MKVTLKQFLKYDSENKKYGNLSIKREEKHKAFNFIAFL